MLVVMEACLTPGCDYQARWAFDFFIQVCAPMLENYGSQRFWNQHVLQACFADRCIKHLVVAAAGLGSHRFIDTDDSNKQLVFLSHYGLALKLLSQARDPDYGLMLMACLLLILCDEFQQNSYAALQHLMAGRKILAAWNRANHPWQYSTVEELGAIFSKLELHTGEFNQEVLPQFSRWPLPSKQYGEVNIQHFADTIPRGFITSIEDAAESLQTVAFECTSLQLDGNPPQTRFQMVPPLTQQLNDWLDDFQLFEENLLPAYASASSVSLRLLRSYHLAQHVLSRCAPFTQESAFDSYCGNLEHLVVSAGLLFPSTTVRLIPILFLVATRYRDASFRRRAHYMLRQCGLDGQILAKIAFRAIRIEEKTVDEPIVCTDVPETSRIRLVKLTFDASTGNYILYYRRFPYADTAGPLEQTSIPTQGFSWTEGNRTSDHAVSAAPAVSFF